MIKGPRTGGKVMLWCTVILLGVCATSGTIQRREAFLAHDPRNILAAPGLGCDLSPQDYAINKTIAGVRRSAG